MIWLQYNSISTQRWIFPRNPETTGWGCNDVAKFKMKRGENVFEDVRTVVDEGVDASGPVSIDEKFSQPTVPIMNLDIAWDGESIFPRGLVVTMYMDMTFWKWGKSTDERGSFDFRKSWGFDINDKDVYRLIETNIHRISTEATWARVVLVATLQMLKDDIPGFKLRATIHCNGQLAGTSNNVVCSIVTGLTTRGAYII